MLTRTELPRTGTIRYPVGLHHDDRVEPSSRAKVIAITRKAWNMVATLGRFAAIGMAGPIAWAVYFYTERKEKPNAHR